MFLSNHQTSQLKGHLNQEHDRRPSAPWAKLVTVCKLLVCVFYIIFCFCKNKFRPKYLAKLAKKKKKAQKKVPFADLL